MRLVILSLLTLLLVGCADAMIDERNRLETFKYQIEICQLAGSKAEPVISMTGRVEWFRCGPVISPVKPLPPVSDGRRQARIQ